MRNLSKSKIIAFRQCPKRLWLEIHKPELRDDAASQAAFAIGNEVGEIARQVFDPQGSGDFIDNSFIYPGGGEYEGLFEVVDLTEETICRHEEVREWVSSAHDVISQAEEPWVETGGHCGSPFVCPYSSHCNRDKTLPVYPLGSLPRLHPNRRAAIEAAGTEDLREAPDELLSFIQQRVKECSATGVPYLDAEGAASELAGYGFPAYFLDLTGNDPSQPCAVELIRLCGGNGPVFAYNAGFESGVIRRLAERFPEHAAGLLAITDRIVDLLPIARRHYYHPSQHGSWSLKAVLPAAVPDLSYSDLEGVQDGMMAQQAYMEALTANPERKEQLRQQLHEYCKLDTLAMVRLWEVFRGISANNLES